MFSRSFWKDAAERAAKTAAQFGLATVGQDWAGVDLFDVDWKRFLGSLGVGAVFSLLTSLASQPLSGTISPASAVKE